MKILHLTVVGSLAVSIKKQLLYESQASDKISAFDWSCIALHYGNPDLKFERQIPIYFRSLFLRNLYAWIYLLRVKKNYDVILFRYIPFDPFVVIFGWFIHNRVSIHHSKEIEELPFVRNNWTGTAASMIERFTGWVSAKQIIGALGVTNDIIQYEAKTYNLECPLSIYPNGISVDKIAILEDRRESGLNIAFVCSSFSPWHGLERLVKLLSLNQTLVLENEIKIHLIGSLTPTQNELIEQLNKSQFSVCTYGLMKYEDYSVILSMCDMGFDALAIDLKGLTEAATLKAREYLAFGLPVYSTYKDVAIPTEHPYYKIGGLDMIEIIQFTIQMKKISRSEIRESSTKYIEKEKMMINLEEWLKNLQN